MLPPAGRLPGRKEQPRVTTSALTAGPDRDVTLNLLAVLSMSSTTTGNIIMDKKFNRLSCSLGIFLLRVGNIFVCH